MTCGDVRDLLPALSLDAVEVDERDLVEDHLSACRSCVDELRAFQEVATALALMVPEERPPARLKRRLLNSAAATASRAESRAAWWARFRPAVSRLEPATLVAAIALVIAIGTSLWAFGLQAELDAQTAMIAGLRDRANRYDRVVAVLQAPDMRVMAMEGTTAAPSAVGRVYVDPASGAGMMMVRSLPALPQDRVYQLWWVRSDGTRQSGGVLTRLDNYGNGYTLITCPESLRSWQWVGLTEEPSGGSSVPTGQRLLGGQI